LQIVVWSGATIADWRKKGFQNDPSYASFKVGCPRMSPLVSCAHSFQALLAGPLADAQAIVSERFPVPRIIQCDQHTSQARYLTASVDPAITYTNNPAGPTAKGEAIFTEDVNLSVFMQHLKKLCVST
jgi:protein transport protein SEC23